MFGRAKGYCTNWTGCPDGQAKRPVLLSAVNCQTCGSPLAPVQDSGKVSRLGLGILVLFVVALAATATVITKQQTQQQAVSPEPDGKPAAPMPALPPPTPEPVRQALTGPLPPITTEDRGAYGVIEIGATGIKAFIFDIDRAERDPECRRDQDEYIKCLGLTTLDTINRGAIIAGSEPDTVKAVVRHHDTLTQEHMISPARIFIVGSSSVAMAPHRDNILAMVTQTIKPRHPMEFITAEREAAYGFEGALGMIPAQWRADRDRRALSLDIGGGNSKGAYREVAGRSDGLVTYDIPYGTKSFVKYIVDNVPGGGFAERADRARAERIDPQVRSIATRLSGIGNRDRVYLMGGIIFALVTHTQPDTKASFPIVELRHIDSLMLTASRPDAVSVLCTENPRLAGSKNLKRACDSFQPDDLIAGLELLRSFVKEMRLDNKRLFFMRDSMFAWPMGYAIAKVRGDANRP